MIEAYSQLHLGGRAQSIEVRHGDNLMAGLYGVSIGRMFFGESMFTHRTDASKIALAALVAWARHHGIGWIDCQQQTQHLARLGARPTPVTEFLSQVQLARQRPAPALAV